MSPSDILFFIKNYICIFYISTAKKILIINGELYMLINLKKLLMLTRNKIKKIKKQV
jgi:hypothetical protein